LARQGHSGQARGRITSAALSWPWLRVLAAIGCSSVWGCGGGSEAAQRSEAVEPVAANPAPAEPNVARGNKKNGRKNAQKRARRPVAISNNGVWWRAYAFFAPDSFEGYKARTATEGHDIGLSSKVGFVSLRRAYAKDGVSFELELLDVAHCPRLRDVFLRSRELSRESESVVIRPMKVQSERAVTQWLASNNIARTSVLVADRFLVNVNVKPASSPNASIAIASKLDFAGLEKLATVPAFPDDQLDTVDVVAAGEHAAASPEAEPTPPASVAADTPEATAGNAP
jgi:hypothetical protein